jgi:hypothetical protein
MVGFHILTGQIQSQAMSHAKFIFLIALVVFFIALFVAAYVWMRRPEFGQKGRHHARPTASDPHVVPADAPRMTEGPSSLVAQVSGRIGRDGIGPDRPDGRIDRGRRILREKEGE